MISTAPIVKKKEDNNLLKGQRTFITLQYDAENEIKQGQLSSFWLHRVIKRVFRKEREQSDVFFSEPKNVWEIMLQIAVPAAGKWRK